MENRCKGKVIKTVMIVLFIILVIAISVIIINKINFRVSEKLNKKGIITATNTNAVNDKTTVIIAEDGAIVCESLVAGIRDCDLADGNYIFRVTGNDGLVTETKDYPVELINYYDDVTYSLEEGETEKTISLGDDTTDYKMLAVKYHKDLTIDEGVTLTATSVSELTYKKGMYLCVVGDLKNNGTITMTARGTYNCEGENVYLLKKVDGTFEYIPAIGGLGGIGVSIIGNDGETGKKRATGGGGSGASAGTNPREGGNGGSGTSYSGGSGGGGTYHTTKTGTYKGSDGSSIGGPGGIGAARSNSANSITYASGGAGNLAGAGAYAANYGTNSFGNGGTYAENGTGGLVVIYADEMYNGGIISSNGSDVKGLRYANASRYAGGGGSGGGSINIFTNKTLSEGSIVANGGVSTVNPYGLTYAIAGFNGGNGAVTVTEIKPNLNYKVKSIRLQTNETYNIDKSKISIVKNIFEEESYEIENATYKSEDTSIAEVDKNGVITAIKEGKTKIIITDTTLNIETCIFVEILDGVKADVQEGNNFTIALKEDGTVWSYGLNDKGQLGNGTNENSTEPVQVKGLTNIKSIATGYSHSLALDKDGNVYAWGSNSNGELGNMSQEDKSEYIKVTGLRDIVKIDAYKNMSLALDINGKIYIWGMGYSIIPARLMTSEKVVDIDGMLILTERGNVYNIADTTTPIIGLSNILKISCGAEHYLAIAANGKAYAWGNNSYGECGVSTVGKVAPAEIATDIYEIKAGNGISVIQNKEGKVYVLGNNANGQLGLDTVSNTYTLTELTLENTNIQAISAGEGTHTSVIDSDYYIWNTGTNISGELGTEDTTDKKVFSKIGGPIITTNFEEAYAALQETVTIIPKIENKFNLRTNIMDENQENFTLSQVEGVSEINGNEVTILQTGIIEITVTHNSTQISKTVKIIASKKMDSIVQGFRDNDIQDGEYIVTINNKEYQVELINYYDDVTYSLEEGETEKNISLGDNSTDYKMLVVKYHKNLTINKGVTLTATTVNNLTYKKGMYICVLGDVYNNGNISMTARGTYNCEGEDVYLWQNINNTYEYVPAIGASGATSITNTIPRLYVSGNKGFDGTERQTGGGGTGSGINGNTYITIGEGGTGTSYSGGSGSGAAVAYKYTRTATSTAGSSQGGAGSNGVVNSKGCADLAFGGTGNPSGAYARTEPYTVHNYVNKIGTGGLLIMYANNLCNVGSISSEGVSSSTGNFSPKAVNNPRALPGGSSGGGSINIFANRVINGMSITAEGGEATRLTTQGGAGGNGAVTINELGSVLSYSDKTVTMNESENYQIDQNQISYTKLNDIQTHGQTGGTLIYESLNTEIATVDNQGKITAISCGKTRIKITDTTIKQSTYVIICVKKEDTVVPQIEEANNFTVTLKSNGAVWSYGLNDNGQLGNNTTVNSNEPVQVKISDTEYLTDIVDISANISSASAVNEDGEVYTWGLNEVIDADLNIVSTSNIVATKVRGLNDIVKVNCYNNNFYAIDKDGNLFAWGKDYENITRINNDLEVSDISKNIVLGKNGFVYYLENLTKHIECLYNIVEISAGEDHYLALTVDGYIYSFGGNSKGQIGNGTQIDADYACLVNSADGMLTNIASVSAGNLTSMALTFDGKVYAWGDNTNNKIGIEGAFSEYATQITNLQEKDETAVDLINMEVISAGVNKSSIMDENGFVYSVGLNTYGELGTGDNVDRKIYTKANDVKVVTNPEIITVVQGEKKNIVVSTWNTLNLKTDVVGCAISNINNTNEKIAEMESIPDVDNIGMIDIVQMMPNFVITGNNQGRTAITITDELGNSKNIWINVVANQECKVSSKVENGNGFTVLLKSNGTVHSYGLNSSGQLGLGDKENRNSPQQVDLGTEIIEDISVGGEHVLVLTQGGNVYSYGLNSSGQLGSGNTTTYTYPIRITNISKIKKVVAINNTSFAIDENGKVYAWGYGYSKIPTVLSIDSSAIDIGLTYYLSDEGKAKNIVGNTEVLLSYNETDVDEEIETVEEKIVQISQGYDHTLLLGESGIIYSIGQNVYGQLGDGTTIGQTGNVTTATRLSEENKLSNIIKVSAGKQYSIAIDDNGKMFFWGKNEAGELCKNPIVSTGGLQENSYAFENSSKENIVDIAAGTEHTTVSDDSGDVYCFGNGDNGELGNCETIDYYEPQLVGEDFIKSNTNEILIEVGESFNVESVIKYFNLNKDITTKLTMEALDPSIVFVKPNGEVTGLKEGKTTVVVKEDSSDKIGVIQVRILETGIVPDSNTVKVEPQTSTGGSHTVSLKVDGTVWSYGQNDYGQLGNGTTDFSDVPIQVIFPEETIITKVAAGENHNLALDSEGNVWSWGRNNYYQLGNKTDKYISIPKKITEITKIKDIECGTYNSFAVTEDGEVYAWGLNANGECGVGSYTGKITIIKSKYMANIIDIKAGKNHTIALKSTGEVYVTGSNLYGELGNSNYTLEKQNIFTKVETLNNVVAIGAGSSTGLALTADSEVYIWGSNVYGELGINSSKTSEATPTKIDTVSDIRYLEGGTNTNQLIDSIGNVYVAGINNLGNLGDNTKDNVNSFKKLDTISNVMNISAGNTYTTFVKSNGTVWATGDYNHGDIELKSRTAGKTPIQVGNNKTGFRENEILVKVNGTQDVTKSFEYAFNLISLEDNLKENLVYESLNSNIAVVEAGVVTGIKTGKTWIKAIVDNTGDVYIIKVNVVEDKYIATPQVEAGQNFAVVLKSDGTIYSYGYNSNGELGDGTTITKDVPTKTNVIATYKDISVGENYFIALRDNNTVWSVGINDYGQLGTGDTKSTNVLAQIEGITDASKIAAGKQHVVVLDSYGIMYGIGDNSSGQLGIDSVGKNILKPVRIPSISERILDVVAGDNQTIAITSEGKVYGWGNILNGYLSEMNTAVKVQVGNGYLLILTSENKIYKYDGVALSKIANVSDAIDISVKENVNMYQSIDEKTYTWGDNTYGQLGDNQIVSYSNPKQVNEHGENTYGIGAGYNNTYIIENTGSIYGAGTNEYGSLGNSARTDSMVHVLLGNREFTILPTTGIMTVNDKEEVTIESDTFNVFEGTSKQASEYKWESDNIDVVYAENGVLTAYGEGTANIAVIDKITNEKLVIERYVQPIDMQRINTISVNSINAEATGYNDSETDIMTYSAKILTKDNNGVLEIKALNETDLISLDKDDWITNVETGILTTTVNIVDKITEIPIYIKIENGTIIKYILTVEKISTDVGIKKITLTSGEDLTNPTELVEANAVGLTKYEAVVSSNTVVTLGNVLTNSAYAYVSIDGKTYTLNEQNKNIVIGTAFRKEINITIKSESGIEQEYTLVIYKESELAKLEKLTVNEADCIKVSEGKYSVIVNSDVTLANIYAKAASSLVEVSVDDNTYMELENTNIVNLKESPHEVSVKMKFQTGEIKEYVLEIYKKSQADESLLNMVMVNGTVIMPNDNGIYEMLLPSAQESVQIRAIATNSTSTVQVESNIKELSESNVILEAIKNINTYSIIVTSESGKTETYTLKIKKAEADTSIGEIYVQNGDFIKSAVKKDELTYEVRVPTTYAEIDLTAITQYANANIKINQSEYLSNSATENVVLSTEGDTTILSIIVKSEDETVETTYTLNIVKMSSDTTLKSIFVNDIEAIYSEETEAYEINLTNIVENVSVKAITNSEYAQIKIGNNSFNVNNTTETVIIDSKIIIATITVKAEDGTIVTYNLNIQGVSDNTNILKVVVNGTEGKYNYDENRYIAKSNEDTYNIEITPENLLAKVKIGEEAEVVGIATTTVQKNGNLQETIVTVIVTAQDGVTTQAHDIVIKEKSDNAKLNKIVVNGEQVELDELGNYKTKVKHDITNIEIEAIAEEDDAKTAINTSTNDTNSMNISEAVIDGTTVYMYAIVVTAENGTAQTYNLQVEVQDGNTNLLNVGVSEDGITYENATALEDGTYNYKINRLDNAYIKLELESESSTALINGIKVTDNMIVELTEETTEILITVISEDGTQEVHTLNIEKMSDNTEIKLITGTDIISTKYEESFIRVLVNEDLVSLELTIETMNENSELKLSTEEQYVKNVMTKTIECTNETEITVDVKSENGDIENYVVVITKIPNLTIKTLEVNSENAEYNEIDENYYKLVSVGSTADVTIETEDSLQTVSILTEDGTIIATGIGSITQVVELTNKVNKFVIQVKSHTDIGNTEYELVIEQKSQEVGIGYVKVDNLGILVDNTGLNYSTEVLGSDTYPIEIKIKDSNAKVKLQDETGNVISDYEESILSADVDVQGGENKKFIITVMSENGEEQNYNLFITRVSNNTEIEAITVEDLVEVQKTDEITGEVVYTYEKQVKNVTEYDATTKTYSVIVNKELELSNIVVTSQYSTAEIKLDSGEIAVGTATIDKTLKGLGNTNVAIEITAADGTIDTKYLNIIQLSDEVGLENVTVDGVSVALNGSANYEITVTDETNISSVYAKTKQENAKISINNNIEQISENTENIDKETNRRLEVPIKVTAEDGTEYTYAVIINIISHDTSVKQVEVDGERPEYINNEYRAFIDNEKDNADIVIKTGVEYSKIRVVQPQGTVSNGIVVSSEQLEDGTMADIIENAEELRFTVDTKDMEVEGEYILFTIVAEDGTETEYTLHILRKSVKSEIEQLYVNGKSISAAEDGIYYANMPIGDLETLVKIVADNEYAKIEFEDAIGTHSLEQYVDMIQKSKTISITITSQQGIATTKSLIITKVSSDANLKNVKVDSKEAEVSEKADNSYIAYIYDTAQNAIIDITANNEYAKVQQVAVDENQEVTIINENPGRLELDIPMLNDTTVIYFRIIAESDEVISPIYALQIEKMSTDTTLKEIYVNGVIVTANEDGKYITTILDTAENPTVKAITNSELAYVRVTLGDEALSSAENQITLSTEKETIVPITVRSQSGITKVTNLYIEVISTSLKLDVVTVDNKEALTYNERTNTYEFVVNKDKEKYELFVMTENAYTDITYESEEYIESLRTTVEMESSLEGKSVTLTVTSENGEILEYTILLIRESDNTDLEYLKIAEIERTMETDEETYTVLISHLQESVTLEIKSICKFTSIKIADLDTVKNFDTTTIECDLNQERIIVPIVVTAPDGVTVKTYNVILIRGSNDTSIELKVNDNIIEQDNEGNYVTNILDIDVEAKIEGTVTATTVMGEDSTKIDINSTGIYESRNKIVTLSQEKILANKTIIIPIEVFAEDGTKRESILTITVLSTEASIGEIEIDETFNDEIIKRTPVYDEDSNIYQGKIKYLSHDIDVVVRSTDENATIVLLDENENEAVDSNGNIISAQGELTFNVQTIEEMTFAYFKIISEAEITTEFYILRLDKMSNNTLIEKIEVNEKEASKDIYGNYNIILGGSTENVDIEVFRDSKKQKITINEIEGERKDTNLTTIKTIVPIEVIAEDETIRNIALTIIKSTSISGVITTENFEGKHSATITVSEIDDETGLKNEIATGVTEEDGSYEIDVYVTGISDFVDINENGIADALEKKYEVIITKDGYLDYTVTNVDILEAKNTDIGKYDLVAGDVAKTEIIEIIDLVVLNENFGFVRNDEDKIKYDFNEDGKVDSKDSNILKKNYGKAAKKIEWFRQEVL